jgi:hypothetical protein
MRCRFEMETKGEFRLGDWGQGFESGGVEDSPPDVKDGERVSPKGEEATEKAKGIPLVQQPMTSHQRSVHLKMFSTLPVSEHKIRGDDPNGNRTASEIDELKKNVRVLMSEAMSNRQMADVLKVGRATIANLVHRIRIEDLKKSL